MSRLATTTALIALMAAPALAQSGPFAGLDGNISLEMNYYDTFGDGYDQGSYTGFLTGRVDLSFGPAYGLGVSAGYIYEQDDSEYYSDRVLFGLHPFYQVADGQIGAFIVSENHLNGDDRTLYGIEGQSSFGAVDFYGYVGAIDDSDDDLRTFGLAASYEILDWLDVYAKHRSEFYAGEYGDGRTLSSIGVTGQLSVVPLSLSAEYGELDTSEGVTDQISVKATYTFGEGRSNPLGNTYSVDYYYD